MRVDESGQWMSSIMGSSCVCIFISRNSRQEVRAVLGRALITSAYKGGGIQGAYRGIMSSEEGRVASSRQPARELGLLAKSGGGGSRVHGRERWLWVREATWHRARLKADRWTIKAIASEHDTAAVDGGEQEQSQHVASPARPARPRVHCHDLHPAHIRRIVVFVLHIIEGKRGCWRRVSAFLIWQHWPKASQSRGCLSPVCMIMGECQTDLRPRPCSVRTRFPRSMQLEAFVQERVG